MNTDRPYDVIAAGGICIDLVCKIDELPTPGMKVMCEYVGKLSGGPAPNFACVLAAMGFKAASMASVGADADGQLLIDDFVKAGVSVDFLESVPGFATPFTIPLIEPSGERSILLMRNLEQGYNREIARRAIPQARAFYMMPSPVPIFAEFAQIARDNGTLVMVDIEPTTLPDRRTLDYVLSLTDIASFNRRGFAFLTNEDEPTFENMRPLLDLGPHTLIVTRDKDGAIALTRDEQAESPGHAVNVVDTTGAGDTFNAGFLAGTLKGWSLRERVRFANAAASISVTGLGPRGHLPTTEEVLEFLKTHP